MNTITSLYTSPCYNPYFNSKNGKKVESIKFFKDGEIIASVKWFTGNNGSNNRYPEINLPTELKEKRKEDLNLKFCFLFNACIYIPADLVNFRDNGEKFDFETDYITQYKSTFSIDVEAVGLIAEIKEEGGVKWTKDKMQLLTITEGYKYRQVEKPAFIEAGNIADIVKKEGADVSRYDILKMMKIYNFSKI